MFESGIKIGFEELGFYWLRRMFEVNCMNVILICFDEEGVLLGEVKW